MRDTIRFQQLMWPDTDAPASFARGAFRRINRVVLPAVDAGFANPLPIGLGAVVLETTGRVTGKPRRVPLLSWRVGNRLVVSSVRSDSQWFANLEAAPNSASVRINGRFRSTAASLTRGPLNVAVLDLH